MRGVAQTLQPVEFRRFGRVWRGIHIDNDQASAGRADARHFPQDRGRVREMVHRETRDDDGETVVLERQRIYVSLPPLDVGQPLLRREPLRLLEHCRGHVDTGRPAHMRGEGADDDAAAAGEIENRIVRSRPSGLDDHPQRVRVGDRGSGAEQCRLPRELVQDQALMARVGHWSGPLGSTRTLPCRPPCCALISADRISSIG